MQFERKESIDTSFFSNTLASNIRSRFDRNRILLKIGDKCQRTFLIRCVLFPIVEFNQQIRRWLLPPSSSSSSSPSIDIISVQRSGITERRFILFYFFSFFLFNIVFSGEKNGWKPLSAIVGIWRDSRTPSEGEDSPVSRTVTGKNSRQVRFAVWKWKNNGVGQTLVFPCKLFTILPISMVQTFGHRLAGGKEIVLLFRDNSLLGELDREGNRGRKRRIEKNVLPVGMKENSRLRYLRDCTRLVGLEIKKTEGRKGPVITFPSS